MRSSYLVKPPRKTLKAEIATLCHDLSSAVEALRTEMISNTQWLRHDLENEIGKLRRDHKQVTVEQATMAQSLNDALERIAQLERQNKSQSCKLKRLQEKCADLESRSRRQNLRIIGVPEGS